MRLSEEHIFKGYWWLPENPNNKLAGILTYTPGESMCHKRNCYRIVVLKYSLKDETLTIVLYLVFLLLALYFQVIYQKGFEYVLAPKQVAQQ